ncbi:hypothetical protein RYZ26_03085 [Terasakiella sp. A23]|uniref:hypothetical protein n=1 Tax=Terasakiella sp. FCG-A23 TaxID=3080561 RepID=UPI002952A03C|nr:hypothetical protein [Terasakiella sp. A23]MDV7338565.1 hypothetical protein [Terasakiella sp. A23]
MKLTHQCALSLIRKSKESGGVIEKMSLIRSVFALCMVIFAASCTGGLGPNDPISRKFNWFSYVNGDDIRKVCADLGTDRYRFVYNGIYQHQTRSYDVFFYSKKITMQVRGEAYLNNLKTDDLLAPWRGVQEDLVINDKLLDIVRKTLKESGALHNNQKGLRLSSDKFYWTVAACVDGEFHFDAYLWGTPHWDDMAFDDLLLGLDVTGVKPVKPRVLSKTDIWGSVINARPFVLEVGENGLVGFAGGTSK